MQYKKKLWPKQAEMPFPPIKKKYTAAFGTANLKVVVELQLELTLFSPRNKNKKKN